MCCPKCAVYTHCSEVKELGESNPDCCEDCECITCENHPNHNSEENVQKVMQRTKHSKGKGPRRNPAYGIRR